MATNHFIPRGPYARKQECTDCNNNEYDNRYFDGNGEDDRKNGSKEKVPVKKNPVLDSVTDRNKECKKEKKKEDKDDCFDPKDLQENDRNLPKPLYWYLNEKMKDGDKYKHALLEKYVSEGYRVIFHIRYDDFDNDRQSKEVNVLLSRGKANKGTVMFTQEIGALQMRNNKPSLTLAGPIDRIDCSKFSNSSANQSTFSNFEVVGHSSSDNTSDTFKKPIIGRIEFTPLPVLQNIKLNTSYLNAIPIPKIPSNNPDHDHNQNVKVGLSQKEFEVSDGAANVTMGIMSQDLYEEIDRIYEQWKGEKIKTITVRIKISMNILLTGNDVDKRGSINIDKKTRRPSVNGKGEKVLITNTNGRTNLTNLRDQWNELFVRLRQLFKSTIINPKSAMDAEEADNNVKGVLIKITRD